MKQKIIRALELTENFLNSFQTIYNYTISIALIIWWVIVNYANLGIGLGLISIGIWWLAITEWAKVNQTLKRIEQNTKELKELTTKIKCNKSKRINKSKQPKENLKQTTSKSSSKKNREGTNKIVNSQT